MKWILYGPDSLLLQFADTVGEAAFAKGRAIIAELENRPPQGLVEFIPAFTTILLEFNPDLAPDLKRIAPDLADRLEAAAAVELPPAPVKEMPVIYDGPDLARVAALNRLDASEIAELHAAPVYKVYALGFSPGFAYLGDLHPRLHTPRLASPRPRVPAGSVGIGGEHTGVYTVESPGGWNLIGRTPLKIFDPDRIKAGQSAEAMFFLRHGDRVRFVTQEREVG